MGKWEWRLRALLGGGESTIQAEGPASEPTLSESDLRPFSSSNWSSSFMKIRRSNLHLPTVGFLNILRSFHTTFLSQMKV